MRRKQTVEAFLEEANNIIEKLKEESWAVEEKKSVPLNQIKVYQVLTSLKKALGDLSIDIFEATTGTTLSDSKAVAGKRGHSFGQFPYGLTANDFRSRVGCTHPDLLSKRNDLYTLLESMQPYKLGQRAIYDLCDNRNTVEHDNIEQTVKPLPQNRVDVGGSIRIEDSTNVVAGVNIVNGKLTPSFGINSAGNVHNVKGDSSMMTIKQKRGFTLTDTGTDLLDLVQTSYQLIDKLKEDVYAIL